MILHYSGLRLFLHLLCTNGVVFWERQKSFCSMVCVIADLLCTSYPKPTKISRKTSVNSKGCWVRSLLYTSIFDMWMFESGEVDPVQLRSSGPYPPRKRCMVLDANSNVNVNLFHFVVPNGHRVAYVQLSWSCRSAIFLCTAQVLFPSVVV